MTYSEPGKGLFRQTICEARIGDKDYLFYRHYTADIKNEETEGHLMYYPMED